jgi:hypothetical protein
MKSGRERWKRSSYRRTMRGWLQIEEKRTTPCGSAKEYVVPKWIINEDRPAKRCGIEDMVSSMDTSSDTSTNLGDEVNTPWLW